MDDLVLKILSLFMLLGTFVASAQDREKHTWTLGYKPDKVIPFQAAPGVKLALHAFFPKDHTAADKRATVVFFFGGGWMGGSPNQFYAMAKYFASRGMVAISAQYRTQRSNPKRNGNLRRRINSQRNTLQNDPRKPHRIHSRRAQPRPTPPSRSRQ